MKKLFFKQYSSQNSHLSHRKFKNQFTELFRDCDLKLFKRPFSCFYKIKFNSTIININLMLILQR